MISLLSPGTINMHWASLFDHHYRALNEESLAMVRGQGSWLSLNCQTDWTNQGMFWTVWLFVLNRFERALYHSRSLKYVFLWGKQVPATGYLKTQWVTVVKTDHWILTWWDFKVGRPWGLNSNTDTSQQDPALGALWPRKCFCSTGSSQEASWGGGTELIPRAGTQHLMQQSCLILALDSSSGKGKWCLLTPG